MKVHPLEADLLHKIRQKYQFGEIIIETRDGLPYRIGRSLVYDKLSTTLPALTDEDTAV